MTKQYDFYLETPLAKAMIELCGKLQAISNPSRPINIYVAGGMAVHLYTAYRSTGDIDAEFGERVYIPGDLFVSVKNELGENIPIYFDTNYNSTFGLMHEDYIEDSVPVNIGLDMIRLHVLSPVDLAVSKIARFHDRDKEDIVELVRYGLTSSDAIEARAMHASTAYVGGLSMVLLNIKDAVALAKEIERNIECQDDPPEHKWPPHR